MLKHKITTYIEVDYSDLNTLVAETYGLDEFCGILECSNDTSHTFLISPKELDKWEIDDLAEIKKDKGCTVWQLHTVLTDLSNKGLIPMGQYLIHISW